MFEYSHKKNKPVFECLMGPTQGNCTAVFVTAKISKPPLEYIWITGCHFAEEHFHIEVRIFISIIKNKNTFIEFFLGSREHYFYVSEENFYRLRRKMFELNSMAKYVPG